MSDTFDRSPPTPLPMPGWYRDPTGHGDARYWNGVAWTDAVSRGSITFQSPMPADDVRVPPVPGTEYRAATPTAPAAPPVVAPTAPPPRRSSGPSILVGIAVAGALVLLGVFLFSIVFDDDEDPSVPTEVPPVPTAAPEPTAAPPTEAPPAAPAEDEAPGASTP